MTDRPVEPNGVERLRIWDSCALSGFTRMAGGFNPRRAVHDRRNRRFFRKLAHYFIERELSMACVGCGRCAAVCHGDIGMPSVVEIIRRRRHRVKKHESVRNRTRGTGNRRSRVVENVYLPKVAVLDRVVSEIHEVKTFYWHFEDGAEQQRFPALPARPVRASFAVRSGRVPDLTPAQSDRGRDVLYGPAGGQLHFRAAPAQAGRQVRGARALRQRLSDGRVPRQEPRVRCRAGSG